MNKYVILCNLCWICCYGLVSELDCHLERCISGKSILSQRQKNFRKETRSILSYSLYKWNTEIIIEWQISCYSAGERNRRNCPKPTWESASVQNVICRLAQWLALTAVVCSKKSQYSMFHSPLRISLHYSGHVWRYKYNPYPTAFPYGNGMVLHFYQQQESSTTKTVHKVINKGLKTYV